MTQQEILYIYDEGYNYFTGKNGYPLNYYKAYEKFKLASNYGCSNAMNYLGVMYENGHYVKADYVQAVYWYHTAIKYDNENSYAAYNLGRLVMNGCGVPKNIDKAFVYFDCALALGLDKNTETWCAFYAGLILIEKKEYEKAMCYFMRSGNAGDLKESWHNVGWLVLRKNVDIGPCRKKDEYYMRASTARYYFEKAAKKGFVPSMLQLVNIYHIFQKEENAYFWLEKAAATGDPTAKKLKKVFDVADSNSIFDLIDNIVY